MWALMLRNSLCLRASRHGYSAPWNRRNRFPSGIGTKP
jgi:hypothetical protein